MKAPLLVDAVTEWLAEARSDQPDPVRPAVWADTVDLMTRAAHAAAVAADPHRAAAQVGWSTGWACGAAVGIEDTAATVLRHLQSRDEALALADHAPVDLDQLRWITGELLRRPDQDPLVPPAPPVPAEVVAALEQRAAQVTGPAARLVGFTAQAFEVGSQAGRVAGIATAVDHLARAAAGQRIRGTAVPGPSRLVEPQKRAPAAEPPDAQPPHRAALRAAFPGPPRPAGNAAPSPARTQPADGRSPTPRGRHR